MSKEEAVKVQGCILSPKDIVHIRDLIQNNPSWSRRRLSQELSQEWNWRNATGQIKDMACRSLLLKLEKQGHIRLPPRRRIPINRMLQKKIPSLEHDQTPIVCPLPERQPLRVFSTAYHKEYEDVYCSLLSHYHYKGYRGVVGENMKYIVLDRYNRVVSCLLFGSSAWGVDCRDRFIGWDSALREKNLFLTTNNMRFLILPWLHIPHLASHILSLISQRISADWCERYGHALYLLETFVETERFRGTCYKASNWIWVGQTKGRSRNDRYRRIQISKKEVYLYPLHKNYREKLVSKCDDTP